MPFIAADGTNYETANALVSVDYADDYFSLRGNEVWASKIESQKQAALIKATDFIEQKYRSRFIGTIINAPQLLSWPRFTDIYDDNEIPDALKKAVCELALESLTAPLNPNLSRDRAVKRKKVDVIETEYFDAAPMPTVRPMVDGYLVGLLRKNSLNVPVVRA